MHQASFSCPQCQQRRLFTSHGINHTPHILASVFLCGLWLPVWLLIAMTHNPRYYCSQCGYSDSTESLQSPKVCGTCSKINPLRQVNCFACKQPFPNNMTTSSTGTWFSQPGNIAKTFAVLGVFAVVFGIAVILSSTANIKKALTNSADFKSFKLKDTPNVAFNDKQKLLDTNSDYFEVVKLLGRPDKIIDHTPGDHIFPKTILYYADRNWLVFFFYNEPFDGTFKRKQAFYVGTKGLNPSQVIHAAEPKYAEFLEKYQGNLNELQEEE